METNLVKNFIENGGDIHPLIIPSTLTNGTGLCNPSIYIDKGEPIINVRHVSYSLYFSEKHKFMTKWGYKFSPFCYLHPEDDIKLRTINYLCNLDKDSLEIKSFKPIDTSTFDVEPIWEFIGLEDVRLVRWDNKLYACGVRRDTTTNGEGRMEMSEIVDGVEISRNRIQPPKPSYCEKNWMPILDMPYHFVKWTNPTEVVKVDLNTNTSETVHLNESSLSLPRDLRGGSQVIKINNYYVAITHEVDLWLTKQKNKDGRYYHRFVVWDENWVLIKATEPFHFMSTGVEFCCGITEYNNKILISFGFQDNSAFLLEVPKDYLIKYMGI